MELLRKEKVGWRRAVNYGFVDVTCGFGSDLCSLNFIPDLSVLWPFMTGLFYCAVSSEHGLLKRMLSQIGRDPYNFPYYGCPCKGEGGDYGTLSRYARPMHGTVLSRQHATFVRNTDLICTQSWDTYGHCFLYGYLGKASTVVICSLVLEGSNPYIQFLCTCTTKTHTQIQRHTQTHLYIHTDTSQLILHRSHSHTQTEIHT